MNKNPLVFFCIFCVKAYSYLISPIIGKNCRFLPTCSEYAIECFRNFGFIKGGWLSIKRMLKCHPWGNFGYDPVFKKKDLDQNSKNMILINRMNNNNVFRFY